MLCRSPRPVRPSVPLPMRGSGGEFVSSGERDSVCDSLDIMSTDSLVEDTWKQTVLSLMRYSKKAGVAVIAARRYQCYTGVCSR